MIATEAISTLQSRVFAAQWERVILPGEADGVKITKRLDDRCRVTMPSDVCEYLELKPGDFVELIVKKLSKPKKET